MNFKKRQEDILSVYHKTIEDTDRLNYEIKESIEADKAEIDKLNSKITENYDIVNQNNKILSRLKKLLNLK